MEMFNFQFLTNSLDIAYKNIATLQMELAQMKRKINEEKWNQDSQKHEVLIIKNDAMMSPQKVVHSPVAAQISRTKVVHSPVAQASTPQKVVHSPVAQKPAE